jgi:hypothetical protein
MPTGAPALSIERLVGAWRLVEWRVEYSDGRATTYPFGRDAVGLLQYTADGGMNASIMRPGRPALSAASAKSAPVEQRLAAFDGFFSYGGTFTIRAGKIVHHVDIALNPNFIGTEQVRTARFEGDTMTLAADDPLPGAPSVTRHHALTWRRA